MGGKRIAPMMARFMRAVEGGEFVIPKGWGVLMRYPTEQLTLMHPAPKSKRPHRESLYRAFFDRYPLAKTQPLQLNSTEKPLARIFVEQQQRLMKEEGLSAGEAMARTEQQLRDQLDAFDRSGKGAGLFLKMAQQEEEVALQKATRSLYAARNQAIPKP